MSREEAHALIAEDWDRWVEAVESFPESRTREEGIAGHWSIHDLVGHVHSYARFYLSQARGAMSGTVPDPQEWYGDRPEPPDGKFVRHRDHTDEHLAQIRARLEVSARV